MGEPLGAGRDALNTDEKAARRCDWCKRPIGVTARAGARFCSPQHKSMWHNRTRKRLQGESAAAGKPVTPSGGAAEARSRPRKRRPYVNWRRRYLGTAGLDGPMHVVR